MILDNSIESFNEARKILGIPMQERVVGFRKVEPGLYQPFLDWQGKRYDVGDVVEPLA